MRPSPRRLLNILVPVKRAVDYSVKIRVNPAQTGVDTNVKHSMNPFDEIAVEESIRIRERSSTPTSITALTIGPPKALDTLRTALAVGADTGVHVSISEKDEMPEPLGVAKAIYAYIEKRNSGELKGGDGKEGGKVDCVILGKQAIDDDSGVTGQMLAGLLGWPQATFASKVEVDEAAGEVKVTREIDGGGMEVRCKLPVVITTDLRLNEPRYASLPNIMKAKKKPVLKITPEELGVDFKPQLEVLKVTEPPKRVGGGKVESVEELVGRLKEAGVTAV